MNKEISDVQTPEELHAHLDTHLPKIQSNSMDWEANHDFAEITDSPHFNQEHFNKMLTAATPISAGGKYDSSSHQGDTITHLSGTPFFTKEHADSILSNPSTVSEMGADEIARLSHKADPSKLESIIANHIGDHEAEVTDYSSGNISHDFIRNLKGSKPKPFFGEEITMEQDSSNKAARKTDLHINRNSIERQDHTPETLDEAVNYLTDPANISSASIKNQYSEHSEQGDRDDYFENLASLVDSQDKLTSSQLNKIWERTSQLGKDYDQVEVKNKILSHKNVDKALLSKEAKLGNEEALANPSLPKEVIDSVIRSKSTKIDKKDLIKNPALTSDQVKALADQGIHGALGHENARPEDIEQAWNTSDKSTESARKFLSFNKTPTNVLSDLVNHKNQDVAVDAVNHHNSDMSVVQAGLSRKAKTVQDAARKHHLVADQEVKKGFLEGKVNYFQFSNDKELDTHFEKLSVEEKAIAYKNMGEQLIGNDAEVASKHKIDDDQLFVTRTKYVLDENADPKLKSDVANSIIERYNKRFPDNAEQPIGRSSRPEMDKSFAQLISNNVPEAQEAALKKPGYLMNNMRDILTTGNEFNSDVSQDFLTKAFSKMQGFQGQLIDSNGRPTMRSAADMHGSMMRVAVHPNFPDSSFLEFCQFTKHKTSDKDQTLDTVFYGKGNTVFDQKYRDLSEPEKEQKFAHLHSLGWHNEIAASEEAPKQMRDQSFNTLNNAQKRILIDQMGTDFNIANFFSKDSMRNALTGRYNLDAEDSLFEGFFQEKALKQLDPSSLEHRELFQEVLGTGKGIETLAGKTISDASISTKIHEDWYKEQPEFIMSVAQDKIWMYSKAATAILDRIDDQQGIGNPSLPETRQQALAFAQKAIEDFSQINGVVPAHVGRYWSNVLDNKTVANLLTGNRPYTNEEDRENNGALDYLLDQAQPDSLLLSELVRLNVLSPTAIEKAKGMFSSFTSLFNSLNDDKARNKLIVDELNSSLSKQGTSAKISDVLSVVNDPEQVHGSVDMNLEDNQSAAADKILAIMSHGTGINHEDVINACLTRTNNKLGNARVGYSKEAVKGIATLLASKITNSELPFETKTDMLYDLQNEIDKRQIPMKSMVKELANLAIAGGNLDDLINIIRNVRDIPSEALKGIQNAVKDTSKISLQQAQKFLDIDVSRYDHETYRTVLNAFDVKNSESLAVGAIDQASYEDNVIQMMNRINQTGFGRNRESAKVQSNILQKYAATGSPELQKKANNLLIGTVSNSSLLSDEDKISNYKKLPSEESMYSIKNAAFKIDDDIINHPDVIETTQGVKLAYFLQHDSNVNSLNPQNLDIIVGRAMEKVPADSLIYLTAQVLAHPNARPETVTKVVRTSTPQQLERLAQSQDAGNHYVKHLEPLASRINENLETTLNKINTYFGEGAFLAEDHKSELMTASRTIAHLVKNCAYDEMAENKKEKQNHIDNLIEKNAHIFNLQAMASNTDIGELNGNACEYLAAIGDTDLSFSSKSTQNLLKVYSMAKKATDLDTKIKGVHGFQKVIKLAEGLNPEDWKDIAHQHPEFIFGLENRQVITPEILDSIDYSQYSNGSSALYLSASNWYSKMDYNALHAHGKKIAVEVLNNIKRGEINDASAFYGKLFEKAESFLSNKDVKELDKIIPIDPSQKTKAVENGVGGPEFAEDFYNEHIKNKEEGASKGKALESYAKSKYIPESRQDELFGHAISGLNDWRSNGKFIEGILQNPKIQSTHLDKMTKTLIKNHKGGYKDISQNTSSEAAKHLFKASNISYDSYKSLYDATKEEKQDAYFARSASFHPAFTNPVHGAKLLRELPAKVPKAVQKMGVSEDKLVTGISISGKSAQKIQEIMAVIPPEGIDWVTFKKKYPKYESNQEVKSVFMEKGNQPVMPEDLVESIKKADENDSFNEFHLTVSHWDSELQTHANKEEGTNAVFQINSSEKLNKELGKDPKVWGLYQMVLKETNGINGTSVGVHPTTPQCVGWSRVDVSNKGAWIIEEFQSDVMQKFRKNVRSILANSPEGIRINGDLITPDELKKAVIKIDKALENWSDAAMNSVVENAKSHGITKLYMHGSGVRSHLSGNHDAENLNPRLVELYDTNAKKYGFQECQYSDYPNANKETLNATKDKGFSTSCWAMDLTPKKTRKKA